MSEEIKNMDTEQQPTDSTPEDKNGGQGGEKMFTQEEVNKIVADRLARERAKGQTPAPDQRELELQRREQELQKRDVEQECIEYLERQNKNYGTSYPAREIVSLLGAESLPKFKDAFRNLISINEALSRSEKNRVDKLHVQPDTADSLFRDAFGLKRKE